MGCGGADFSGVIDEVKTFVANYDCKGYNKFERLFKKCYEKRIIGASDRAQFNTCVGASRKKVITCHSKFNHIERSVRDSLKTVSSYLKYFKFKKMSDGFFTDKLLFFFDQITSSRKRNEYNKWKTIYGYFIQAHEVAGKKKEEYPKVLNFNPRGGGYDITVKHAPFDITGYNFKRFDAKFLDLEIRWLVFIIKRVDFLEEYKIWVKAYKAFKKEVRKTNLKARFPRVPTFRAGCDLKAVQKWEGQTHNTGEFYVFHGVHHNIDTLTDEEVNGYCDEYIATLQGVVDQATYVHLSHEYKQFVVQVKRGHKDCNCPQPRRK